MEPPRRHLLGPGRYPPRVRAWEVGFSDLQGPTWAATLSDLPGGPPREPSPAWRSHPCKVRHLLGSGRHPSAVRPWEVRSEPGRQAWPTSNTTPGRVPFRTFRRGGGWAWASRCPFRTFQVLRRAAPPARLHKFDLPRRAFATFAPRKGHGKERSLQVTFPHLPGFPPSSSPRAVPHLGLPFTAFASVATRPGRGQDTSHGDVFPLTATQATR